MSVTLINIFEVPAGDEDQFIAAWEKTRDYLKTFPAHIETALHQSLHDTQFRFVNIAHWTSEDEFNAAVGSQGFRGGGIPAALAVPSRAVSSREHRLTSTSAPTAQGQSAIPATCGALLSPYPGPVHAKPELGVLCSMTPDGPCKSTAPDSIRCDSHTSIGDIA
jgi:heme-degrading monooxygenase HmoA